MSFLDELAIWLAGVGVVVILVVAAWHISGLSFWGDDE